MQPNNYTLADATAADAALSALQVAVCQQYGSDVRYPKDCQALAESVRERTGQVVSLSTLKRVMGLVPATSGFSRFTLDVLATYAGFASWEACVELQRPALAPAGFGAMAQHAALATNNTLSVLREQCGLAYEQTIARHFALEHWQQFRASTCVATAFVAEGGYGKSVLLAHLVEQARELAPNDILWLVPAWQLASVPPGQSLASCLWEKGAGNAPFPEPGTKGMPNVYILLDGLDEATGQAVQQEVLFRLLSDAVAAHPQHPWLRLVMTTRPVYWEQFVQWMGRRYPRLHQQWFGISFDLFGGRISNVPLLEPREVRDILSRLPQAISYDAMSSDMQALIQHPYYLQLLAQASPGPVAARGSKLTLLRAFLHQRVHSTRFGFEKTALLNTLIKAILENQTNWQLRRTDFDELILRYYAAYEELLTDGILREERSIGPWQEVDTYIRFGHDTLLEYMVARHWLETRKGFTLELARAVVAATTALGHRLEVVKYLVLFALQQKQFAELSKIFDLALSESELVELGHFLGMELRTNREAAEALNPLLAAQPSGQLYFVETFVDQANLNRAYRRTITAYLQHKQTPEAQLFGNCMLFLGDFLKEDYAACTEHIAAIRRVPHSNAFHSFPQGRRVFSELVHQYFVEGQPEIAFSMESLQNQAREIPRSRSSVDLFPSAYQFFPAGFHYFVAEAFFLMQRYAELLEWHDFTLALYPELEDYQDNVYTQILQAFRAVALLHTGRPSEAEAAYRSLALREQLDQYSWFKDYYIVYYLLTEVHFGRVGLSHMPLAAALANIEQHAINRQMPFYTTFARRLVTPPNHEK
ncbi:hypothetical protein [Hymenobacter sp. BT491]|uniref:hypothetical protein n=1 Tax=Hymenobacter sp. BT491 TaxID=2766779 RepID=UPI00165343AE|nr:hypothetical protein [Hymenobacter sp. BT491]MBC6988878.1 hypothetical protein [Hymenobacter sp. BT491]